MLIDGKKIAEEIINTCAARVARLPYVPICVDIVIGSSPVNMLYAERKQKAAKEMGIDFRIEHFGENAVTQDVIFRIKELQNESYVCGLVVQLPIPPAFDVEAILNTIQVDMDVDCLTTQNSRDFFQGKSLFTPPTALAVWRCLESIKHDFKGKHFLVLGQGKLVGTPVTSLLKQKGYVVDVADINTPDIPHKLSKADVIITATGSPKSVTGEFLKSGVVVIDAGAADVGGKVIGDVDMDSVAPVASAVSPVPGGVGPVTVATLLENVVIAAEKKPFWV